MVSQIKRMQSDNTISNKPAMELSPEERQWVNLLGDAFVGDVVACLSITMAIKNTADGCTESSPSPLEAEFDFVEWPDDFIPTTNQVKPTEDDPTPLEDRFRRHLAAIDKRTTTEKALQPELSGINLVQFEERLRNLRVATVKWGAPRIEAHFVKKLNAKYPSLRVNDNKEIKSSADFCQWIKKGPWNKCMREVVAYASGEMWEDNNQWAINLEVEYHNLLRVKCSGLLSNGSRPKKSHKGKCSAAVFVKGKGSLVGKIRNCCKRRWKEAVYCRTEKPRIQETQSPSEGDSEEQQNDDANPKETRKTKKIPRLVLQEEAEVESHGFHGYLGKCDGHESLAKPSTVVVATAGANGIGGLVSPNGTASISTVTCSADKRELNEVEKWLRDNRDIKTLEDVYGALLNRRLETPTPKENKNNAVDDMPLALDNDAAVDMQPAVAAAAIDSGTKKAVDMQPAVAAAAIDSGTKKQVTKKRTSTAAASSPSSTATARTPSKRKGSKGSKECDHSVETSLVVHTHDDGYFKPKYLEKTPLWPKKCDQCKKVFVMKHEAEIEKGDNEVSVRERVYLCRNGANSKHPCCFGLCRNCKVKTFGGSPRHRRHGMKKRRLDDDFEE